MTEQPVSERRTVYYEGRVQGVGFRYTTVGIADRFAVTGYVKNLSDGRVQLVVEGDAPELDRFLAAVESQLKPYIRDRRVTVASATSEFTCFNVRH